MTLLIRNALQIIGFQAVWLTWALGIPNNMSWPGALTSTLFLACHVPFLKANRPDRQALAWCLIAGFALDSLLQGSGWLTFQAPNPEPLSAWQPWWMALLWACLACTLNHSLAWLRQRGWVAVILSAISGLLSYRAAAETGALNWSQPQLVTLTLLIFWGGFIPWVQSRTQDR
jgi:hypothetical protein